MKHILKESTLAHLEELLPTFDIATEFTDSLRGLRFVCDTAIAKEVDQPTYREYLDNFSSRFEVLNEKYSLSETLKIHVIRYNLKEFFLKLVNIFVKKIGNIWRLLIQH